MANYSRPHLCHCLTRLASVKRNAVVTVYGQRRRTGQEFVDGVLRLAEGLVRLGLRNGDVVSIAALNRSNACVIYLTCFHFLWVPGVDRHCFSVDFL